MNSVCNGLIAATAGTPSIQHITEVTYHKISNMSHQISKFKCFSSCFAIVFAQSIEARCQFKNEDVVGSAPTGDAPIKSEW